MNTEIQKTLYNLENLLLNLESIFEKGPNYLVNILDKSLLLPNSKF